MVSNFLFAVSILQAAGLQLLPLQVSALGWVALVQGPVQASWWEGLVPAQEVELSLIPLWVGPCQRVFL